MPSMSKNGVSGSILENGGMKTSTSSILSSANGTLKDYVEEMIIMDKRFSGMSRYVFDINFYWSYAIKTACAGHGFIFFNPDFWDALPESKKKTVVAHEIFHLILDHLKRGEGFDPDTYNIAADHVINIGLDEDGFDMKGDFAGIQPCFDKQYRGMSTEQIYRKIWEERKKNPSKHKPMEGTPSPDQIEDLVKEALEGTGKDLQEQIEENEEKRSKAEEKGKQAGNQSGSASRILQTEGHRVFIKEATYEEIFEEYLIDPLSGGKRTFLRPSRRQIKGGLRLKGKFKKTSKENRLTHLVYALDVSGSITSAQANQFLKSAATLKEKLKPKLMTVMLWDTRIKFEKTFREDEKLDNIRVQAGGGTCLDPVYARVRQLNPEALVIFTDLCVTIPPKPEWETIWFVPNKGCSTHHVTYGNIYLVPE